MSEPYGSYPQVPQAYGQPYPMIPQEEHPQGTTVLVLGILGFFVAGVCAPFAWYLGSKALREGQARGIVYANQQSIVVGRILGMVMTILAIVGIVIAIALVFVFLVAVSAGG